MNIYLYSTVGCHLCDQAKTIVWPLLLQYQLSLVEIDIATSDELIELYGTRIPVLSRHAEELSWPFGAQEADQFFAKLTAL